MDVNYSPARCARGAHIFAVHLSNMRASNMNKMSSR